MFESHQCANSLQSLNNVSNNTKAVHLSLLFKIQLYTSNLYEIVYRG